MSRKKAAENGDLRTKPIEIDMMLLEYDDLAALEGLMMGKVGEGLRAFKPILARISNWTEEEIGKMPVPRLREVMDQVGEVLEAAAEAPAVPNADSDS